MLMQSLMAAGSVDPDSLEAQRMAAAAGGTALELRTRGYLYEHYPEGIMNRAYPFAAFLRCVFALVMVPVADRLHKETVRWLRQPVTQLRLISLLRTAPTLCDCHAAAKFLRVMC